MDCPRRRHSIQRSGAQKTGYDTSRTNWKFDFLFVVENIVETGFECARSIVDKEAGVVMP